MRSWPGLAAVGAGLIHLGISAGSAPLQLALFALVGVAEAGWGVLALAGAVPRPAASFGAAVVLVVAQLAVLLSGSHEHGSGSPAPSGVAAVPLGALVGAILLDLALAALLAVRLRRGSGTRVEGGVRFLLGAALGAAAVAIVTATSPASTALGGQHLH